MRIPALLVVADDARFAIYTVLIRRAVGANVYCCTVLLHTGPVLFVLCVSREVHFVPRAPVGLLVMCVSC